MCSYSYSCQWEDPTFVLRCIDCSNNRILDGIATCARSNRLGRHRVADLFSGLPKAMNLRGSLQGPDLHFLLPSCLFDWANVPVEVRRAVKSLVDVLLPMASREATQLCRAADSTVEFFKLARIASSKDIAIVGWDKRHA